MTRKRRRAKTYCHRKGQKKPSEESHPQRSFFVPYDRSTFSFFLRFCVMDLLRACDEMKDFIGTAQKLVDAWDADPDNYSQLEEGLSALKTALEKFKD